MSLRVLPVAGPLASLLLFSAFVVAQVNVTANCTLSSFSWTFNSKGQSPCIVAAYMLATCYAGAYTLEPLPSGYAYSGPTHDFSNKCECSTIGYSLAAACDECQGQDPFYWSSYVANCTSTLPAGQFPNPVPAGIYVPYWATLDVTNENKWDAQKAQQAGDTPEYGPGAIFGASGVSTSSASASATSTGTHSHSKSHGGAIAGGVVGGLALISIVAVAIFFVHRRRSQALSGGDGVDQSMLSDGAVASTPSGTPLAMKFYDPNDPTTFPGYQGGARSQDIHSTSQVPLSSHVGSGSSLADMHPSQPHNRGSYHGLPMPSA